MARNCRRQQQLMARHSCRPKGADSRLVSPPIDIACSLWSNPVLDLTSASGFLVHFEGEVLKRAHRNFSFRNGSIGNYFLAAAQGFFRSLPSAVFLFSSITGSQVPAFPLYDSNEQLSLMHCWSKGTILPVLVTNHTVTIAAELVRRRLALYQHH